MLTARKVFSYQLRHLGRLRSTTTWCTVGAYPASTAAALLGAARGWPRRRPGARLVAEPVVARVDALGAEGHADVARRPSSPRSASGLDQEVVGAADVRRRGEDQRLAGPACSTTDAQARRRIVRSGTRCSSTGVGTQTMTVRASLQAGGVDGELEAAGRGLQGGAQPLVVGREQIHVSGLDVGEPGGARIDPEHPPAGGVEGERGGQADVAEADDPDVVPEAGRRGHRVRPVRSVAVRTSAAASRERAPKWSLSSFFLRSRHPQKRRTWGRERRQLITDVIAPACMPVPRSRLVPALSGGRRKEKNTSRHHCDTHHIIPRTAARYRFVTLAIASTDCGRPPTTSPL